MFFQQPEISTINNFLHTIDITAIAIQFIPSFGHLPYILLNKIQGRSLNNPLFVCITSLMFCLAKHKGEGLLPFYRIIYRIAALRGVALVILGRCHKVTEGLKKIIWG